MTRDCSLNYKKNTSSEHVVYKKQKTKKTFYTQHVLNLNFSCNSMTNLLSYCRLIDTRMKASEDLPVTFKLHHIFALLEALHLYSTNLRITKLSLKLSH